MHNKTPTSQPPTISDTSTNDNGMVFLRKVGHLYKKTGLRRSWRLRYFSLEGTVLFDYKRKGDSTFKAIVVLTGCHIQVRQDKIFYSFRISHPKTSKTYDLAAKQSGTTDGWINALSLAAVIANPGRQLVSRASTSNKVSRFCRSKHVNSFVTEPLEISGVDAPNELNDMMEQYLGELLAIARDDGWQLRAEERDVKMYMCHTSKVVAYKSVCSIAHHPHKALQFVLDLSKRHRYDPQLLTAQRVVVFNEHTWVDHLTYVTDLPAMTTRVFRLMHWRVLQDGSIIVVTAHSKGDHSVKNFEPQIFRVNAWMAGSVLIPNANYTGVNFTYINTMTLNAPSLQFSMLRMQASLTGDLLEALDNDETFRQWEHVTNATVVDMSRTECLQVKRNFHSRSDHAQDHGNPVLSCNSSVAPEEGYPAVPEEYSELIESAIARMEVEINDERSWNYIKKKDGVKAYTKLDGSLTAAKGVGYLPYHPRAIWEQAIDVTKRSLVDPQLACGIKLKTLNAQTTIDYLEYKSIFFVAGRDFCNLTHWRVMPDGAIIVVAQSIDLSELCPVKEPTIVRGILHFGCIKIVPNAMYDGAEVITMVKTDLRGDIPARIAGKAAAEQPFVISRMGGVIKARPDLDQIAAQGKLANTLFQIPHNINEPSSLSSAKSKLLARESGVKKTQMDSKISPKNSHPDLFEKISPAAPIEKQTKSSKCNVKDAVESLSKDGQTTASDLAMYAIQFGGAVLALKTVSLHVVVHLTVVVLLIMLLTLKLKPMMP
ncbi:hypothetical protein CCR75_003588 [Bremia lactucae]|uniref:PH domain-containing protein n=1 Tax=Bremia lactucae TaxID=4779 RepID=A0A976FKU3_BRELC|nr:hypothetical protein CCR75_003588 [Bremia lactucae]